MPGQTLHGLPYPLPTDQVSEGAADMRALAEAVDGSTQIPLLNAGANLRLPLYGGELAILIFDQNEWHGTETVFGLARGWATAWALAPPVLLTQDDFGAAWAVPGGDFRNDPQCWFNIPVAGGLNGSYALQQRSDVLADLRLASTGGIGVTFSGLGTGMVGYRWTGPGGPGGAIYLQTFSPGGHNLTQRCLKMTVHLVVP
jgi:hypothetical protein